MLGKGKSEIKNLDTLLSIDFCLSYQHHSVVLSLTVTSTRNVCSRAVCGTEGAEAKGGRRAVEENKGRGGEKKTGTPRHGGTRERRTAPAGRTRINGVSGSPNRRPALHEGINSKLCI